MILLRVELAAQEVHVSVAFAIIRMTYYSGPWELRVHGAVGREEQTPCAMFLKALNLQYLLDDPAVG